MPLALDDGLLLDAGWFLDAGLMATPGHPVTPQPSVRVLWRPEQFTRITNPIFATDTSGWSVLAGINAAGTSITRTMVDSYEGVASGALICGTTDGGGVNFDLGSDRYYAEASYGAIYVAVVWLRRVSGTRRARVILGSEGTSADRATLTITDLSDGWRPYTVRWLPTANRTDAQLAITNGSAEACNLRIGKATVYQVDAFSQCENGTFEVDTTGWTVVSSGTITRTTTDPFGGTAYALIGTSSTQFSGVDFALGTRKFTSGRTYRLRLAARTVSGSAVVNLGLGDVGAADRTTSTPTLTASWAWYTVDWTPSADRTAASVTVRNNAAAANTFEVDEVEVYEASDDLGNDVQALRWTRSSESVGTIACQVLDHDGAYDPRNSAAALYGSLSPGKRIWGRATYGDALHALFYGTLTTIEAPPLGGVHADLVADDMMADLARAQHGSRFHHDTSYRDARARAIAALMTRDPRQESTTLGSSRCDLSAGNTEAGPFFAGTDDLVPLGEYLSDLNAATQAVHHVVPSVHANIGWRYTTVDRVTLTDTSSDWTVDEDFRDLTGVRYSHETLENQQTVPWQSYQIGPLPRDWYWVDGTRLVATAQDREAWANYGWLTDDDPYLHYMRDEYGDNSDVPEPTYLETRRWKRRRKGRKIVTRRRRVYPDPFVPFAMGDGDVRIITVDFALPMYDLRASVSGTSTTVRYIERSPTRITFEVRAEAVTSVSAVFVIGTPFTPLDELEVQRTTAADTDSEYAGPRFGTPYIGSLGAAEGIAEYRNWRYGEPRLRPTVHLGLGHEATMVGVHPTDHLTLSADRWRIDGRLHVVLGGTWEVRTKGMEWSCHLDLEELPTHTDWFVLGTSSLGGAHILAP